MSGLRTRSAVRVTNGPLTMSHTSTLWYAATAGLRVVGRAHQAAQPPVRRMQAVRVVMPRRHEARRDEAALEGRTPINADVAARRVVVFVGERPVDRLGHAAGHRDRHGATRLQDPGQLSHGGDVVRDVLEHLGRNDPVERPVGKGQGERVTLHGRGRVIRR